MKQLVLIRHGESEWNRLNLFTGWTDVELTDKGLAEAHEAGRQASDDRNPRLQAQYRRVPTEESLPLAESLATTIERVVPYFETVIRPQMAEGQRIIIAAHGNSLRALVKYFDKLSSDQIMEVNIPTGVPLVYEFDDNFQAIKHYYLGDQEALAAKMSAVANQGKLAH